MADNYTCKMETFTPTNYSAVSVTPNAVLGPLLYGILFFPIVGENIIVLIAIARI